MELLENPDDRKQVRMTPRRKLQDLLAHGESETVEFKERFGAETIETAVAFANTCGGHILIGVNDNGKVTGQRFGKEGLRDYVNRIATATEPAVIPNAEKLSTPEGDLIILTIGEAPLRPIATHGRSYRRAGSTTRVMKPSEIATMHLSCTGQSMDAMIVERKTRDDLDFEQVRLYMRKATAAGRRNFSEHDEPWEVLQKLELVKSGTEITRAAVLLFGKTPQSPLTQAVVHVGRLRQVIHIMDNRIIEGSILGQVDETIEFIRKNLHVRFEITGSPTRKEIWDYPLVALREAVANAVCHRDYGDVADIQIKIFEDSLQIWSPGLLPFDVTVEDLLSPTHASKPRNKLIAQVFFDVALIERYGGGIQRMLEACKADGLPAPFFENAQGGFKIRFVKTNSENVSGGVSGGASGGVSGGVSEAEQFLVLIKQQPGINTKRLATMMGRPQRTVERRLKRLKEQGKIEYRGASKTGGYWPC